MPLTLSSPTLFPIRAPKGPLMSASFDHTRPPLPLEFYDGVASKRLMAWVIDIAITAALSAILVLPVLAIGMILIFPLLLIPVIWCFTGFIYRWITISNHSSTWGMRMMAIELSDIHGARLSGGLAFMHTLGTTLSFGVPVVQAASMVMMASTQKGQGLTDMALGTTMLNKAA